LSPLERRIFRPAKLVGPDEESAIKQAIEEFNVAPQLHNRLFAQRRP
jgi:hypothetical protein